MVTQDPLELYTKGTSAWIEDSLEGWARVTITSPPKDGQMTVEKEATGEHIVIKINKEKKDLPPLDNPALLQNVDDLTTLSYLHEPAVLFNVKLRYSQRIIYTYSGIVLVAVNPFQKLNIYGHEMTKAYAGKQKGDLEPHLFSVAEDAFRSLVREGKNQSIIVTGESGAGKTVSTKYVMRYFATVESDVSKMSDVEEQVMATNPIMESFGNAKTIRNNNSSRFGKYIEIKFSTKHKIVAANIRTYLLERSRVIFQAENERNYHIFYQLCAGAPASEREELFLGESFENFHYLRQGGNGYVDDVDDQADFKETQNALSKVGMSVSQQWKVFKLLAGLLHLGNIEIGQVSKRIPDSSISTDDQALQNATSLLGLKKEDFVHWICNRNIQTKSETIVKKRDVDEAKASRDAVAKYIYSKLFDWLVVMVNKSLNHPTGGSKLFIGLLDIYGFEIFKVNSFEQFCINYANEKLQQEFVQHVFKLEQQEYVREGISWSFIDYQDNQPCIDLIEAKLGIFGLLDEECRMPKGSDDGFVNKLYATLTVHNFFAKPRFSNLAFIVKHYAQDVCYEVAGFLDKNKDTISDEQMDVLLATTEKLYAEILADPTAPKREKGGPQSTMKATLASTFKASLSALMETLRSTTPNYIRCIKPNEEKAAFVFEPVHVLAQLRACGVLETIRISAAGYPSRTNFLQFAERYRVLAPKGTKFAKEGREYCKVILDLIIKDQDKYQVGKTKIFLRAGQLAFLERARLEKLNRSAVIIQKHVRRMQAVKRFKKAKKSIVIVQKLIRGFLARKKYRKLRTIYSAKVIQRNWRGFVVRKYFKLVKAKLLTIQLAIRAKYSKRILKNMKQRVAAIKIQKVFRGHQARNFAKKRIRSIIFMQCCIRRRYAKRELTQLRIEARSLERYKEVSYKLENKVIELTQVLDEEKSHHRQLQSKNDSLHDEITSLKGKLEQLKPYKEKYEVLLEEKSELEKQIEELLKNSLKEKSDLQRKLGDREAILHQKEADFEKIRGQLETEKKHLKELHDTLKQTHQALLTEVTKERHDWSEKTTQQNERLSRLQADLDRSIKDLSVEKKRSEELTAVIDRLQNDTTEMDGMRKVLAAQLEEMERQKQINSEALEQKVGALKESEEERLKLSRELRARDEKIAQKDIEATKVTEQLELTKREVTRLLELIETVKMEKAHIASLKSESDSLKESLLVAQNDLKKVNKQLQEANEELKVTMTNELTQLEDKLKRKEDDYEQLRKALANEERETMALKEKIIRLETISEASVQSNDLKASIQNTLEESNNELKKLNMSLMESSLKEREELTQKLDQKDHKLDQKEQAIRDLTLELERERREALRQRELVESVKREAELKAEAASLKASMGLQEIQLQVKMQQQQIDQQQAHLQEASQKSSSSHDEIIDIQKRLLKETQTAEKATQQLEILQKDHVMKLRTLEELLSSKTIEVEKAEKRRKEETALLEAKFEEERKAFNKLLRKAAREGQLALGDPSSPEDATVTAVAPIRVQSRDWVVLHRGDDVRSAFGGEFEKELTNRLITKLRPPVFPVGEMPASDAEVLYPAHLIGTALSRMLDLGMEPNFQSLLVAVLRALNTLLQQKKDDKVALYFWLGNTIELRNIVYSLICVDASGKEVSTLSKPVTKLLNDLGYMITEIFHALTEKIKEQLIKVIPAALLMHDAIYANTGFRIFRSANPTPETLTQIFTEVKSMVTAYQFPQHTVNHLFSKIIYAVGTEAFNTLLLKKELCNPKRGISIRFNVTLLEQWCVSNGFPEAVLHFQPLIQAAGLLQQPNKTEEDMETLLDTCFLLNSVQVHKLLTNFRDEMDQAIPKHILKFVYDRTIEAKDDILLERGHHALFSQPPYKILSRLNPHIPPSLKGDDVVELLSDQ